MSLHDAILLLLGMGLGLAAAVFLLGGISMFDQIALARGRAHRAHDEYDTEAPEPVEPRPAATFMPAPSQGEEPAPPVLPEPPVDRAPAVPGAEPVVSREEALHPLEALGGVEAQVAAASPLPSTMPVAEAAAPKITPPVEPAPEAVNRTVEDIFARAFLNSRASRTTPDETG